MLYASVPKGNNYSYNYKCEIIATEFYFLLFSQFQNVISVPHRFILVFWTVFQISSVDLADEEPYSFLGALEEGFFSDLILTAASGKEVSKCPSIRF